MLTSSILVLALSAISPQEMANILEHRNQQLDRLALELREHWYVVPRDASPLDPANWAPLPSSTARPYRLTVVRPNVLLESLLKGGGNGAYGPAKYSLVEGHAVSRRDAPAPGEPVLYTVLGENIPIEVLIHSAEVLQVFDIHMISSSIPQLNLLRLFQEHKVRLVRSVANVHTYTTDPIAMLDGTCWFEVELTSEGTPLRIKSTYHYERGRYTVTKEQFTLRTERVAGEELLVEAVILTTYSPEDMLPDKDDWLLGHIEVENVYQDTSLTAAAVTIEPETRNSIVTALKFGGDIESQRYDANGTLLSRRSTNDTKHVRREELRWRKYVPAVAVGIGLSVVATLAFVSRRRAGR